MIVNLQDYITPNKYFKWSEALYLPSLKVYHSPTQQEVDNIIGTCLKLERFRKLLNRPFNVNCWIRPNSVIDESGLHTGVDYNGLPNIKGAKNSAHIYGLAVDFTISGLTVDQAMAIIKGKLNEYQMCAENNGSKTGRQWVHLQNRAMQDGSWRVFDV